MHIDNDTLLSAIDAMDRLSNKLNNFDLDKKSQQFADIIYQQEKLRREMLDDHISSEPAWTIILDLFIAKKNRRILTVSSVCIGSYVPATTALRHIGILVNSGYIFRIRDKKDGRRVFLDLSDETSSSVTRYFNECQKRFT